MRGWASRATKLTYYEKGYKQVNEKEICYCPIATMYSNKGVTQNGNAIE